MAYLQDACAGSMGIIHSHHASINGSRVYSDPDRVNCGSCVAFRKPSEWAFVKPKVFMAMGNHPPQCERRTRIQWKHNISYIHTWPHIDLQVSYSVLALIYTFERKNWDALLFITISTEIYISNYTTDNGGFQYQKSIYRAMLFEVNSFSVP